MKDKLEPVTGLHVYFLFPGTEKWICLDLHPFFLKHALGTFHFHGHSYKQIPWVYELAFLKKEKLFAELNNFCLCTARA